MPASKSTEEQKREEQRMQDVVILLEHLINNEETTIKLIIECLYDVGAVNFINRKFADASLNRLLKAMASLSKPAFKIYGLYWFKKNCPQLIVNWLQRKVAFPAPARERLQEQVKSGQELKDQEPVEAEQAVVSLPPSPQSPPGFQGPKPTPQAMAMSPSSQDILAATTAIDLGPSSSESLPAPILTLAATTADVPEQGNNTDLESTDLANEEQVLEINRLQSQVKLVTGLLITTLIVSGSVMVHLSVNPLSSWKTEPSNSLIIPASTRSDN